MCFTCQGNFVENSDETNTIWCGNSEESGGNSDKRSHLPTELPITI